VVTSVKDQGFVGTCWSFSAIENIEGQWALAGNELVDLSPEYLVDCDGSSDASHADCSIYGGWPYLAYAFIVDSGGVPSEQAWPYCAGDGSCFPCMLGPVSLCGPPPYSCDRSIPQSCSSMQPSATISSWTSVSSNETEMAHVLVSQGPLSVLIDATGLQHYNSGIWDGKVTSSQPDFMACSKTAVDHAVLIVGYGIDDASETPFWLLKNSWGADWGEEGYFRITRGAGTCAINTQVTTALV
jgi:cathepsin F